MAKPMISEIDFVGLVDADPNVGLMIVSGDGEVIWYSKNVPSLFGADPDHDYVGKTVNEIFHQDFANERLDWIQQVLDDGKTMRVSHVYQGDRMVSTIMPLDRHTEPPYATILTRRERRESEHSTAETFSRFVDLGPLAALSARELEVLVLIGHGHNVPETAKMLHRSPRTIEQHKASIGRKLGISTIADIARMVGEVGLQIDDLKLQQFKALRAEYREPSKELT
jgi:DNA-binding CsgD family transcriptional regulator